MAFLIVMILVGNLWGGPVGDYLGLAEGKGWAYRTTVKDSSVGFPAEVDTFADTTRVLDEFLLDGHPAYLMEYVRDDEPPTLDTLWEDGDSLMGDFPLNDTGFILTLYKTPFEIGRRWGGTHIFTEDIDEDGVPDTITFTDSIRVVSQEDIEVPYGHITDAYKLERKWDIEFGFSSIPGMKAGGTGTGLEWYKPDLGRVKDTLHARTWYLPPGPPGMDTVFIYSWTNSVLLDTWTGIAEREVAEPSVISTANPFQNELSLSFSLDRPGVLELFLYDVAGRRVASALHRCPAGHNSLKLKTDALPAGVYILIVNQDGQTIAKEKVVKVR